MSGIHAAFYGPDARNTYVSIRVAIVLLAIAALHKACRDLQVDASIARFTPDICTPSMLEHKRQFDEYQEAIKFYEEKLYQVKMPLFGEGHIEA